MTQNVSSEETDAHFCDKITKYQNNTDLFRKYMYFEKNLTKVRDNGTRLSCLPTLRFLMLMIIQVIRYEAKLLGYTFSM